MQKYKKYRKPTKKYFFLPNFQPLSPVRDPRGTSPKGKNDNEGSGETVVNGVAGKEEEFSQQHGSSAHRHREEDGTGVESSGQPEGETQREKQRHGTQAEGEEPKVVDEGAMEEVGDHDGDRQDGHDGESGLSES